MADPVAPGSKPIEPATIVCETLKLEDSPPKDKKCRQTFGRNAHCVEPEFGSPF
jgi:hypothetical protein